MTAISPSPTRSRELAAFGSSISYPELPAEVVHHAKRALVDWLAAALAGSAEPAAAKVRRVVTAVAPGGPAGVIGTALRTSEPFAALANAYASHLLDYDDVYNPSSTTIHLSSCVWPSVLAIGQARGLDGRAAVAAYVSGFETGARVACAAGPRHYESGWHVTGTAGHLASAAASAHALGLDADGATHTLGCCATQAAGVREVYGSDTKAMHPGKAAMDGVLAGLLAETGFTSTDTAIEGPRGLLRAITPSPEPELLVEGLGSHWHLLENGHKLYPSASLTHPAIDAALAAAPSLPDPEQVVRIEARLQHFPAEVTALRHPVTGAQAKFSTAHCIAVALLRGAVRPADFSDAVVNSPEVKALRDTVRIITDDTVSKRGCQLRIALRDGQSRNHTVEQNRGTPAAPLRDEELTDKLLACAEPILGEQAGRALAQRCWHLDDLPTLHPLVPPVSAAGR